MSDGQKRTATTYTWTNGARFCAADVHRTEPVCPDCEHNGICADCGEPIAPGPAYRYCVENGECVHVGCSTTRASAGWVDYY
ncbi:hypothetical protein ACN27G_05940 [Plantactinospora sp. WMMB334]|uniref:hypothetical protein n=1 Tax=Plantactinospora sp. WMMB334 TaxID=3404119 RepID=UPI003B929AA5